MPTALGFIFAAGALYCFFRKDDSLFAVVLVSAIFQASSIISAETFGIQPYYAVGSLFVLQTLYRITTSAGLSARFRGKRWMYIFAAVAVLSAVILPIVFAGTAVYNPYAGIDDGLLLSPPLRLGLANFTQSVYLLIDVGVVVGASRLAKSGLIRRAYLLTFYLAAGIIFVQFLCSRLGIPFPYALLQNHGGYSVQTAEGGDWASRLPGTFSESSQAGLVLATFTAGFLAEKMARGKALTQTLMGVLALLLVRSTSSLAALALVFLGLLAANPVFRFPFYLRMRVLKRNAALVAVVALGAAAALLTPLRTSILGVTAGKEETSSFINRMAADAYAFHILAVSHGLGVGLGSNRPSSLIPSLLSTVGVAGLVIFAVMVFRLLGNASGEDSWIRWAGFALIVTMCSGIPDVTAPWLWVVLALAVYGRRKRATGERQPVREAEPVHSFG